MRIFVCLALLLAAAGCKSGAAGVTPEAVCAHQASLATKEFGDKIPAQERAGATAKCVVFNTSLQKRDPEKWKCHSACVLAAQTVLGTMGCRKKCGGAAAAPSPATPLGKGEEEVTFDAGGRTVHGTLRTPD